MIKFAEPVFEKSTIKKINNVLKSKILVHGSNSKIFEKKFSDFTKSNFATSVSSCTAGMHLFYFYHNIGKGDEVIVPAQTHTATAHSVELTGAKAVFVDSESLTGNIDIKKIEKKITSRTKVITIVHYLGIPVNMESILKISRKYNLLVFEDCALSLGSFYKNKHTGLIGDGGSFSFYPVKHITTGEGGMLISKHRKFIKNIEIIKSFGINRNHSQIKGITNYDASKLGFNYRLSEINSVIGIDQLKKIKYFLKIRKKNFEYYKKTFKNLKEFSFFDNTYKNSNNSYYCFNLLINKNYNRIINRDKLVTYLKNNKIGTSIYYPKPVPLMTYYKKKYNLKTDDYKVANYISKNSIALPVGPHLKFDNIKYISNKIIEYLN